MKYYQSLDLIVYDFKCDSKIITQTLNLKPSQVWKKGDLTLRFKKSIVENSWCYSKTYANNFGTSKNIFNFLQKFDFIELEKALKKSYGLQLTLKTDESSFAITSKVTEILAKHNITLEFVYQR